MSDFFSHSRNVSVTGGYYSHVGGDQYNHYGHASSSDGRMVITQAGSSTAMTVHVNGNQIVNQNVQQNEKEHTEFDDFRNVKRGDLCRLRDIGISLYSPRIDCPCLIKEKGAKCSRCQESRAEITICVAEVDESPGQVCTTVSYSGPGARKAFEAEFQTYSKALWAQSDIKICECSVFFRSSKFAQLYAIDKGIIPSLLLRNELMPYAHFVTKINWLGMRYLSILLYQWRCRAVDRLSAGNHLPWPCGARFEFTSGLESRTPGDPFDCRPFEKRCSVALHSKSKVTNSGQHIHEMAPESGG
ncbi:hypothetical protein PM082_013971 [Marasmius tenuissimus]|nr:hypothetical protein PM082_013971 [Marasmius tenuissimus]